jgi:hypothetical protein
VKRALEQAMQLRATPNLSIGQLLQSNPHLQQIDLREVVQPTGGGAARVQALGSIVRNLLASRLGTP